MLKNAQNKPGRFKSLPGLLRCEIDRLRYTCATLPRIGTQDDRGPQLMSAGVIRENRHAHDLCGPGWQIGLCIRCAASVSIGKVLRPGEHDRAGDRITQDHKHGLEG